MDDITLIQDAIDEWRKKHYEISYNQGFLDGYKMCEKRLPRWTPCSEGPPEEGERVLATHLGGLNSNRQVIEHIYRNGEFTCGWEMDTDFHSPTFGQRFMGNVIAWMPLPKPYKGGD